MKLIQYFSSTEQTAIITAQVSVTYKELINRVLERMSELQILQKNSVVWLVVANNLETVVNLFALWELGHCVFTVDPHANPEELAAVHQKLICNYKIDASTNQILLSITETDIRDEELQETALLQLTSGSTGEPKLLKLGLNALIYRAQINGAHLKLNANEKTLCTMPLSHSHGLDCLTLPTLMNQGQVFLFDPATAYPFRILEWIKKFKITFFSSLPQMYDLFNQIPIEHPADYSSLRYPFCGSAALSQLTAEKFNKKFGLRLFQGYGLAEIGVICVNLDRNYSQASSIGKPLPELEWKVGVDGELFVRSKALFQGYFKNPTLTEERFENGFLKTQDLVSSDAQGFLYITGRKNDFINVMGKKVFPREIEDQMAIFTSVKESCVVGLPDPLRGQIPVLFLSSKDFIEDKKAVEDQIISELSKHLEDFKIPRRFIWVEQFPKSPIGKILRAQLPGYATKESS